MTREYLKNKKRIVIKIGTSSLTYSNGMLNFHRIEHLSNVLSSLRQSGRDVVLVSSGAIGVGCGRMGLKKRPDNLPGKQAAAAVGQSVLMKIYQKFFDESNQIIAQVLLTKDAVDESDRRKNAINTLTRLLEMGIIPIINENDTIATEEIEFGDNDTLSAYVSVLIGADLLIILTDIDGLFSADPRKNSDAHIINTVHEITPEIIQTASGAGSAYGTGGMVTKLTAAGICADANIDTILANGTNPEIIFDLLSGKKQGTLFFSRETMDAFYENTYFTT